MFIGILEGLAMIWLYFILLDNNIISDEFLATYDYFSLSFFTTIILYINFKLLLITYAYNLWTVLGIGLSVISYFLYVIFTNDSRTFGYF